MYIAYTVSNGVLSSGSNHMAPRRGWAKISLIEGIGVEIASP
jgi:hypothetical protein